MFTRSREGDPNSLKIELSHAFIRRYLNYPVMINELDLKSKLNWYYYPCQWDCFQSSDVSKDALAPINI